jgi:hypothetical protein
MILNIVSNHLSIKPIKLDPINQKIKAKNIIKLNPQEIANKGVINVTTQVANGAVCSSELRVHR